ncbi:MAG: zinc-dependent alcohol dehydrogenase [Candidatus Thorarchaeota archaeon]
MKSLILTRDGLQLADTPMPPLMPGDVRIEVRSVGISRTDIAIWRGVFEVSLPLVLGHEIAGVVHESSVPEIKPGSLVTTEIYITCDRCWYCRRNLDHVCKEKETLGTTVDGGFAEYVSVPADLIHVLPDSINTKSGVFVEPLARAISTQVECPAQLDDPVLVIGSGKLGILVAQVYDAYGADVYLVGRNQWQLGLARQVGLSNTINMNSGNWKKKVLEATNGVGPMVVAEESGTPEGLSMALDIVRSHGTVAIRSMEGQLAQINPDIIANRELRIQGIGRGSFDKAIDMLAKGRIIVDRLISKEFRLEDGAKAFEHAANPDVIKVIVNI